MSDLLGDMPNSPWNTPSWSSEPDDLDGLLYAADRGTPPSADLRPAADVVAALTAPPSPGELRGLDAALVAFRAEHGMSPTYPRHRYRARRMRARFVVAGSAFAVAFGGATAAAFTGVLPPPAQKVAHALVGAPPVSAPPSRSAGSGQSTHAAPGGVITSGQPRVAGLCTAYRAASKHGHTRFLHSTSFQRLAAAAGGVNRIDAFCAAVPSRGAGTGRNAPPPATPGHGRPSGSPAPSRTHPGGPQGRSAHSSRSTHPTQPGKGLGRTRSGSPSAHPRPHGGSPTSTG
jgi:hypothetical protein